MLYITYDDAGDTTGAYMPSLTAAQAAGHWIEATQDQYNNWCNLHVVNGELAPLPAAPVVPYVPEVISPRQFRQSLTHFDFRSNVEAAVAASDQDTKDWYAVATQFERHHPLVISMAQALGYSAAQIDEVWTYGAAL
jgi:hypothetical protein